MKDPLKFDPDELMLTKDQILSILEAIKTRWKKNRKGNALNLIALTTFTTSMHFIDEKTLQVIWRDIINATNELISLNQMQRMKGEHPKTAEMINIVLGRIERGELF